MAELGHRRACISACAAEQGRAGQKDGSVQTAGGSLGSCAQQRALACSRPCCVAQDSRCSLQLPTTLPSLRPFRRLIRKDHKIPLLCTSVSSMQASQIRSAPGAHHTVVNKAWTVKNDAIVGIYGMIVWIAVTLLSLLTAVAGVARLHQSWRRMPVEAAISHLRMQREGRYGRCSRRIFCA